MSVLVAGARAGFAVIRPHGVSVGSPSTHVGGGGKRGRIRGWSRGAAARQRAFLQGVEPESLTGHGYALTLTVRDCPGNDRAWSALRRRFSRYLRERGRVREHWGIEMQRRRDGSRVPHVHLAVWFDHELDGVELHELKREWVRMSRAYGSSLRGQHVAPIWGATGWSRYVAKHVGRTSAHYQRDGLPDGWESSGRQWGRAGEWILRDEKRLLNAAAMVEFRRLLRSWAVASARIDAVKLARYQGRPVDWSGVKHARRVGTGKPGNWSTQGVNLWIPEAVVDRLLAFVASLPGCWVGEPAPDLERIHLSRRIARSRLRL